MDKDGHILPIGEVWTPDVTDNVTDVTDNVTDNVTEKVSDGNTAKKRRAEMTHFCHLSHHPSHFHAVCPRNLEG
jgi:hypothetical protein